MRIDVSFLPALAAAFMLMFARIGTMVMLLPGLGELTVPPRIRLTAALVLTAVLFPLHRSAFSIDLKSFGPVLLLLGQELIIGLVLGLTARLTISALQVAGTIIARAGTSPTATRFRMVRTVRFTMPSPGRARPVTAAAPASPPAARSGTSLPPRCPCGPSCS